MKFIAILIAILQPFVLIIFCGELKSISTYWNTPFQPLFIITNAITSYFLFGIHRWRFSAFLLLVLTAFSVESYPSFHYAVSALFFISCYYPLIMTKKFRLFTVFYTLSLIIFFTKGILWFEIYSIIVLSIYHLFFLYYKERRLQGKKHLIS